jgi:hypothetical protein
MSWLKFSILAEGPKKVNFKTETFLVNKMDTLTKDALFGNTEILTPSKDPLCKITTWFITYIDPEWRSEEDAKVGLNTLELDLWDIKKKNGEKKLVCAFMNAELCPETGLLHFHICPTFIWDTRPLPSLRRLFGQDARIYAVQVNGVDTVRKYCSKRETRVGGCKVIAESPDDIAKLTLEYVDKWDGRVVRKDPVQASLEREMKLKLGRKNDSEKLKAIRLRERTIADNNEVIRRIAGKAGQKGRWTMLKEENAQCLGEITRYNNLKPGESIHGKDVVDLNEVEEEVEWPEERDKEKEEKEEEEMEKNAWTFYCNVKEGWCSRHRFNWRDCNPRHSWDKDWVLKTLLIKVEKMIDDVEDGLEVSCSDTCVDIESLLKRKKELTDEIYRRIDVWRENTGRSPRKARRALTLMDVGVRVSGN